MTTLINASTSSGIVVTSDNSGEIALQSNGSTKATLTNAGFAYPGAVVQVVGMGGGDYYINIAAGAGVFVDTAMTLAITTKFASSKILINAGVGVNPNGDYGILLKLVRNVPSTNTTVISPGRIIRPFNTSGGDCDTSAAISYLDNPNQAAGTTITYKIMAASSGSSYVRLGDNFDGMMTIMEIAQ